MKFRPCRHSVVAIAFLMGADILPAQTVPSITTLTVDHVNPNLGSVVTLTAKVTVGGAAASGGRVTFLDGTTTIGAGQVIFSGPSKGSAILRTNSFLPKTHKLKALYGGAPGSSQKAAASVSNTITLTPSGLPVSSTILQVTPNADGSDVDLTATVAGLGASAPTGTVRFTVSNNGQVFDRPPASSTPGAGGFLPPVPVVLPDQFERLLTTGDFDNDGRLDLLVMEHQPYAGFEPVELLLNTAQGFKRVFLGEQVFGSSGVTWGDFNNDGLLDIIIINEESIALFVNRPDAPGSFTSSTISNTDGGGPAHIGDFNQDGVLDLDRADAVIYYGDPTKPGTFLPPVPFPASGFPESYFIRPAPIGLGVFADFNGDGLLDQVDLLTLPVDPCQANGESPPVRNFVQFSYAATGVSTYTAMGIPLPAAQAYDVTAHFAGDNNYLPSSADVNFAGVPNLSVNRSALSYGAQPVDTVGLVHLVLTNAGTVPLTLTQQVSGDNCFDFPRYNFCPDVLANGASCTITQEFIPKDVGERLATLTITGASDPMQVTKTIPLAGPGLPALPSGPLGFTPVVDAYPNRAVGVTSPASTITAANQGTPDGVYRGPVTITNIVSAGNNPQDFTINDNGCLSTLQFQGTCMIHVTFKPTAKGSRTGRINFTVKYGSATVVQQMVVYGKGT